MKKIIISIFFILVAVTAWSQNLKGYQVEALQMLKAKRAFVIGGDTLFSTTQTSGIDTTFVTLEYLRDSLKITEGQIIDFGDYQPKLNGTGFVKANGTSISYDNSTYLTGITKTMVESVLIGKISSHYHHRLYGDRLFTGRDLNELKNNPIGLYYDAFIRAVDNNPTALNNANGIVTMMTLDNSYGKQIAFGDDENIYLRQIKNNVFNPWYKFFHSGNSNLSTANWTVANATTQFHAVNKGQLDAVNAKLGALSTSFLPYWDGAKLANSHLKTSGSAIQYDSEKVFSSPRDIVDKSYVDAIASGNLPKLPVDAATTSNITLSGLQTIDGYSVTTGQRVLVKDQTTASQNGVYIAASGAWERSADLDSWDELYKAYVAVLSGGQSGSSFVCNIPASGTLGTTQITWVLYSAPTNIIPGNGLLRVGNVFSADYGGTGSAYSLSRSDHVHSMADLTDVPPFGTTVGTIAQGNDSRILNGQTAFGWGNHADAGYLTSFSELDPIFSNSQAANITATDITNLANLSGVNTGDQDLSGLATKIALKDSAAQVRSEIPTNNNQLINGAGYLTSVNFPDELDPVWNLEKANYFTKTQVNSLPISTFDNDIGFITSSSLPTVNNSTITLQGSAVTGTPQTFNLNQAAAKAITINNTTYSAGTGMALNGTTFNHSNSVTAGTSSEGGITRNLAFGGKFNIPSVSYDSQGHVTGKGSIELTLPANPTSGTNTGDVTLTTTGNSGAATLTGQALNIPNYTLTGLGGQTQLNGTGFVKVSGTTVSYDNNSYYYSGNSNSTSFDWAANTLTANRFLTGILLTDFNNIGNTSGISFDKLVNGSLNPPTTTPNNANGLLTMTTVNGYGKQLGFVDNEDLYIRRVSNNVYSSWYKLWHSGNFTDNSTNWNTAYGWGNHATEGYLKTVPTNISAFNNDVGYLVFGDLPSFGTTAGTITEGNDSRVINGQTAFTWGNHADAGYLTSISETDPIFTAWDKDYNDLINKPAPIVVAGDSINAHVAGAINGTNNNFTTHANFIAGTTMVYVNGVRQEKDFHYQEGGTTQINFISPYTPKTDERIIIDYKY